MTLTPLRPLISRSEAKARELKTYYDGKLCVHGHDARRYTANGACVECLRLRQAGRGDELKKPRRSEPPIMRRREEAAERPPFTGWTSENRVQLIRVYVDTGDIASARDEIGASASDYHEELKKNDDFAAAIAEATPIARQHLRERVMQLALRGNEKALIAALKAEFPEFRDSLKVDMQTTVRNISNDELDRRITRLARGQIIDAQFTEVESRPEIKALDAPGRDGAPRESEQDIDPLLL